MKNFLNIDNLLGIKIYCLGVLSIKHLWNAYLRILKALAFCMISQDLGSTYINLNILHLHASLNNLNYLGCSILFPCIKADFVSCCQVSWIHIIFKNLAFLIRINTLKSTFRIWISVEPHIKYQHQDFNELISVLCQMYTIYQVQNFDLVAQMGPKFRETKSRRGGSRVSSVSWPLVC